MSSTEHNKRNAILEGNPIIMTTNSEYLQTKHISDSDSRTSKGSRRSKSSQKDQTFKCTKAHFTNKNINLAEDCFGIFYDENGTPRKIKRFTWKNHNNIEAQIITYGARITSIKFPNRKGDVHDVVLGFEDLAGYLYYSDSFMGATIGRLTNKLEHSTFVIDGRQFWVNANDGPHQTNGGIKGFDKVIWNSYVSGTKVILSHTSLHLDGGYPGELMVNIVFELTTKNEFRIDMEAFSTKRTIVSISNLMYFNLGGHDSGPDELYKHTVTINANTYTVNFDDGFPTGEIKKVIGSKFDLMIPKILKPLMGVGPGSGFDQNFCVNREVNQNDSFVARAVHTRSGRILEIYSNQFGVNFSTANNFGRNWCSIPLKSESKENIFSLLNLIHNKMLESTDLSDEKHFLEVLDLVQRIHKCKFEGDAANKTSVFDLSTEKELNENLGENFEQLKLIHLRNIHSASGLVNKDTTRSELASVVKQILNACVSMDVYTSGVDNVIQKLQASEAHTQKEVTIQDDSIPSNATEKSPTMSTHKSEDTTKDDVPQDVDQKPNNAQDDIVPEDARQDSTGNEHQGETNSQGKRSLEENECTEEFKLKPVLKQTNITPSFYKDGQLHGKNGAIYKRHGAMAFQTQNYPNAIHHANFPNCTLRPGETYRHTIVYKFWIQSGNPSGWIRRNR